MTKNYIRKVPFSRHPIRVSNQRYECFLCDVLIVAGDYFHNLNYDKRVHLDCAKKADSLRGEIPVWNVFCKERATNSVTRCVLCSNRIMKGDLFYNGGKGSRVHIECGDKDK
jgi:hypothetical protein